MQQQQESKTFDLNSFEFNCEIEKRIDDFNNELEIAEQKLKEYYDVYLPKYVMEIVNALRDPNNWCENGSRNVYCWIYTFEHNMPDFKAIRHDKTNIIFNKLLDELKLSNFEDIQTYVERLKWTRGNDSFIKLVTTSQPIFQLRDEIKRCILLKHEELKLQQEKEKMRQDALDNKRKERIIMEEEIRRKDTESNLEKWANECLEKAGNPFFWKLGGLEKNPIPIFKYHRYMDGKHAQIFKKLILEKFAPYSLKYTINFSSKYGESVEITRKSDAGRNFAPASDENARQT